MKNLLSIPLSSLFAIRARKQSATFFAHMRFLRYFDKQFKNLLKNGEDIILNELEDDFFATSISLPLTAPFSYQEFETIQNDHMTGDNKNGTIDLENLRTAVLAEVEDKKLRKLDEKCLTEQFDLLAALPSWQHLKLYMDALGVNLTIMVNNTEERGENMSFALKIRSLSTRPIRTQIEHYRRKKEIGVYAID
jgi:hypothetical protein